MFRDIGRETDMYRVCVRERERENEKNRSDKRAERSMQFPA